MQRYQMNLLAGKKNFAWNTFIIAPGLMHKTSNIDKSDYSRLLIEFDEKYVNDLDAEQI